ncbi:phosphotransferase [Haloactinospora alba]|uniref:phosphotransferase n=1 Tax=Haloactinospora alba TaxID=405555 RepID=UPI001B87E808|nr:phosphotransferase [Haloactinospora alba]
MPRPYLRTVHDWHEHHWNYRAELYDLSTHQPVAESPVPETVPELPSPWWHTLRTTLDRIAVVPTQRHTVPQRYLDWAMPTYLGAPINTTVSSWATAHGDLHWANLCAPQLYLFDWEGWGLAPTGYDAAMLHSYSLLLPSLAARIRHELAHLLNTSTGRFAELVTITELLHAAPHRDDLRALTQPLRQRADLLLRRFQP